MDKLFKCKVTVIYRFIPFFLVLITFSCTEPKVKLSEDNHLDYLGFKGQVRQVDISITENEIQKSGYVPIGKGINTTVGSLIDNLDYLYGKDVVASSILDPVKNLYDAKSISFNQVRISPNNSITDYQLKINRDGYIIEMSGRKNQKLLFEKKWAYNDNNYVTELIWKEKFEEDNQEFNVKYLFQYNDNGLVKNKKTIWNGNETETTYDYNYQEGRIDVTENETKSTTSSTLTLNGEKEIVRIKNDLGEVKFEDYNIVRITAFDNSGNIQKDFQYDYNGDKVVQLEETKRYNDDSAHEIYSYNYNSEGYINDITSSTDELIADLNFDYQIDNNSNWNKLKINLDKKHFIKAGKTVEDILRRREEIARRLSGYDKIRFELDNYEVVKAKVNLKYAKDYSSQIEIKRDVFYY